MAQSLQSKDSTARGTLQCVQILQERLQGLRAESSVQRLMTKVESCVSADLLQPLSSSRAAKTPARLRDTFIPENSPPHEHVKWRRQFFEALDLVEEELKSRAGTRTEPTETRHHSFETETRHHSFATETRL